jgi:hypothetical protein
MLESPCALLVVFCVCVCHLQERGDSKRPKFGAADMEGWRKDWK